MGSSKKHQRAHKAPPPLRPRTTRSSKGRLLTDPAANTQLLTSQLRQLGLYAADTVGDGNCLFRAISDQMYGTEAHHLQIRSDVCDWIEGHKTRYSPFVEDERGLGVHLSLMRQPATYGGHLELSAFAHMAKRNVKVVQPGLVYVIEWSSGPESPILEKDDSSSSSSSSSLSSLSTDDDDDDDDGMDDRSRRLAKRTRIRVASEASHTPDNNLSEDASTNCVYVAYHDWEHFSSIRNLLGPHDGLPNVRELSVDEATDLPPPPSKSKSKVKHAASAKSTPPTKPKSAPRSSRLQQVSVPFAPSTPSQVPLPPSRSVSPMPSRPPLSAASTASDRSRDHRSPKRTFEESSSGSSAISGTNAKRSRHDVDVDMEIREAEDDADTPALSEAGSSASSPLSSSSPSPAPVERPLTRRQRKVLGLPKPRPAIVVGGGARSAGKIIIPGGRFRARGAAAKADPVAVVEDSGEWQRNGVGRVDVRGFRELRI